MQGEIFSENDSLSDRSKLMTLFLFFPRKTSQTDFDDGSTFGVEQYNNNNFSKNFLFQLTVMMKTRSPNV